MKMAVFWVEAPCSLVEVSEVLAASIIIALMMEAVRTSETLVNFYQTTRCNNPEDSRLQNSDCYTMPFNSHCILISMLFNLLITKYY
jgi:hypothetical protein